VLRPFPSWKGTRTPRAGPGGGKWSGRTGPPILKRPPNSVHIYIVLCVGLICICNFNLSAAAALVSSVRLFGRRISDRRIGLRPDGLPSTSRASTSRRSRSRSLAVEEILQGEKDFEVNYFLVVVDMANSSLKNRFEELQTFKSIFGFLLSSTTLKTLNDTELEACCSEFAKTFSSQDSSDIEVNDLLSELKVMKLSLPERPMSSMEIFEYVRQMDSYLNISIAYRILFTVPVTVASAERSFSKLKLLKNYLRSTMSQDRLHGLATLCIEKKLLNEVDSNTIINEFASRNVRRNF
jgi:hypothetical protein